MTETAPLSTYGIDPPSFDLVLSQLDDDRTFCQFSPNYQVHGNLRSQFEEVDEPEVVPETPPSRQGQTNTGHISTNILPNFLID